MGSGWEREGLEMGGGKWVGKGGFGDGGGGRGG